MAVHRNRVIYQSEALFISPDSTGYHFTGSSIPNAEFPEQYSSIAQDIGPGPFGLMTPPVSGRQVFGGTASNPAVNGNNEIVGWQVGDEWPAWNPDGKHPGHTGGFATASLTDYDFTALLQNGESNGVTIQITEGTTGNAAYWDAGTRELSIETDGAAQSADQLTVYLAAGGSETLTDAGFSFAQTAGNDTAAELTTQGIKFISTELGEPGNGKMINIGLNQGGATTVAWEPSQGPKGQLSIAVAPGTTAGQLIDFMNIQSPSQLEAGGLEVEVEDGTVVLQTDVKSLAGAQSVIVAPQSAISAGGQDPVEYAKAHGTIIKQLKRIQTANYGFTINREDVNQFGHLARLDSIVIEAPTVNLDFSYYLLDGYNERHLEYITNGITNTLSGGFSPELYQAGSNFFILTMPEAGDAVNGDINSNKAGNENRKSVISLGNGYITDYSVDISVGSIPTASVTVEGMNIKTDIGETGNDLPAIRMAGGSLMSDAWSGDSEGVRYPKVGGCTGLYSLPPAESGYNGCGDVAALRPGDVVLDLQDGGVLSKQVSGSNVSSPTIGSAHVQSVSISVPQSRSTLQRLGSTFGFSKTLDVPINITMSVSATLSDLKEGNMADLLCGCDKINASVTMFDPECVGCLTKDEAVAMRFTLKGARLESESFTSTIGDNKSVDLTFVAQIAGADDPDNGLFISGKEGNDAAITGLPPSWTGVGGVENVTTSGLMGYRK
jgi:hypothetical protein